MASIKLQRIADRTPVKMTIAMPPEIAEALREYSEFYAQSYGEDQPVAELIPAMLSTFLDSDQEFRRLRRSRRMAAAG